MNIKSSVLLIGLLAAGTQASIPQGAKHGSWHVTSISSMSGGEGDDAAVMITQEVDGDDLTVRWDQGGRVRISVDINDCVADEDFEQTYAIPLNSWQAMSIKARARYLKKSFAAWVEQARLSCPNRTSVDKFQLNQLNSASDDFNRRLDYFSSRGEQMAASSD